MTLLSHNNLRAYEFYPLTMTDQIATVATVEQFAQVAEVAQVAEGPGTDFVEEGWHESLDEKKRGPGGHYDNLDFLEARFKQGWGQEEGVTYTPTMTSDGGDRVVPHQDEIVALREQGYIFRGRIVCNDGAVYDADMERALSTVAEQAQLLFDDFVNTKLNFVDRIHTEKYVVQDGERAPCGTYVRNEKIVERSHGPVNYTMCDEKKCCLQGHLLLALCSGHHLPAQTEKPIMEVLSNRTMYKKKDMENGNHDICLYCMTMKDDHLTSEPGSPVEY